MKKIFFFLFIFLLPWQTRLILTPEKPEFLSFSIYLSEIFLWLAIYFWLSRADLKKIKVPAVFLFFCFFVFLSIFWSADKISAFRIWLFIFDGIVAYIFLRENVELRRSGIKIFLCSMFITAIFGIWQFINLGSPGSKWLGLAERDARNLGDIVVELPPSESTGPVGERWLRAYGPFPHPNIFGGYLVVAILIVATTLSERSESKSRRLLIYLFAGVFFLALFLTFSRSAWIALAFAGAYFLIKNFNRQTLKLFTFLLFLFVFLSVVFWPFIVTRTSSVGRLEKKSNNERLASWRDGFEMWKQNPAFGSGAGNYTKRLQLTAYGLQPIQPAHNAFLMIFAELGAMGFLIYLFIWRKLWRWQWARVMLMMFFVIAMLDHYLWTLYSGQILFFLSIGLLSEKGGEA